MVAEFGGQRWRDFRVFGIRGSEDFDPNSLRFERIRDDEVGALVRGWKAVRKVVGVASEMDGGRRNRLLNSGGGFGFAGLKARTGSVSGLFPVAVVIEKVRWLSDLEEGRVAKRLGVVARPVVVRWRRTRGAKVGRR